MFDVDGKFLRMIHLNVPYDKKRHPVLGNLPANPPDETAPWTICITNTPTQYLFTTDQEPGRIYKLSLDGTILGMLGEAGRGVKQFNWIHGLACPSEDVVFVADMNNWRIQKITLRPDRSKPATRHMRTPANFPSCTLEGSHSGHRGKVVKGFLSGLLKTSRDFDTRLFGEPNEVLRQIPLSGESLDDVDIES